MKVSRCLLLLALAGIGQAVHAAEAESVIPEPSVFIEEAAQTGLAEIQAAKIALSRSKDPAIRSFAQRMVRDHGRNNTELAALAAAQGIDAPVDLDGEHQAVLDEMTSKSAEDFDRSYSRHMRMGHTRAVTLYEAAMNSPEQAISGFARKVLPALREHQALAEKLPGATQPLDEPPRR